MPGNTFIESNFSLYIIMEKFIISFCVLLFTRTLYNIRYYTTLCTFSRMNFLFVIYIRNIHLILKSIKINLLLQRKVIFRNHIIQHYF
jgi:hypothetical protein